LPFEADSVLRVLAWGATPDQSPYTHQDIAHWGERFWNQFADVDAPPQIESLMPILADVETQWDLFLANNFSLLELHSLNFSYIRLPTKLFNEWLIQAQI
jgi:hypothetical protein